MLNSALATYLRATINKQIKDATNEEELNEKWFIREAIVVEPYSTYSFPVDAKYSCTINYTDHVERD